MKSLKRLLAAFMMVFCCCHIIFAKPADSDFAKKMAQRFIESEQAYQLRDSANVLSSALKISHITPLYKKSGNKEILAYIAELDPEGYLVMSSDTDIYPIIAYSYTGRFPSDSTETPMTDMIRRDMENRLKAISYLSPEKLSENENMWTAMAAKPARSTATWGPWINTSWNQGGYYNKYVPKFSGHGAPTGCLGAAMAQIINYWKWPGAVYFGANDKYQTETLGIRIDDDYSVYDFLSLEQLNQKLSRIQYDGDEDETAALCFAAGVSLQTDYTPNESLAYFGDVPGALRDKFGYSNAVRWKYSDEPDFYSVLKSDIQQGRPAELAIFVSGQDSGHAIVADGYKIADAEYYHLNFGWGMNSPASVSECWYLLPAGMPAGYDVIKGAVVNIYPPTSAYIAISGPSSVSENSYGDYKATEFFSDAIPQDITDFAVWNENSDYASMDASVKGRLKAGLISPSSAQPAILTVAYACNGISKTASAPITIEPKKLISVTITGASAIAGGSYGNYKATAWFDDKTSQDVTKSVVWSENSAYTSVDYLTKGRLKTASVRSSQTVIITARYTYKNITKNGSLAVAITVPYALKSLTITGASTANESSYTDYAAIAVFEDGSSKDVSSSATWTENSPYAYMDSARRGRLRTGAVNAEQSVSITARYTFNGITQTASLPVVIKNFQNLQL